MPSELPNAAIADALEELGDLYELDGAIVHRVVAYRTGAKAVREATVSVAALARAARGAGRRAVISETNSASCGGRAGVSDAPVSGVWAIRYVIASLLAGFSQVRFHSAGTSYDPLVYGPNGSATLRPLGRALLFLHRWLPVGSRIVSVSRDPRVLAVRVTSEAGVSYIYSSFAARPIRFAAAGAAAIRLPPNRIVAVGVRGRSLTGH